MGGFTSQTLQQEGKPSCTSSISQNIPLPKLFGLCSLSRPGMYVG